MDPKFSSTDFSNDYAVQDGCRRDTDVLRRLDLGDCAQTRKKLGHKHKTPLRLENSVTVDRDENSHPGNHRVMPTHTFPHVQQAHSSNTLVPQLRPSGSVWVMFNGSFRNPHSRGPLYAGN